MRWLFWLALVVGCGPGSRDKPDASGDAPLVSDVGPSVCYAPMVMGSVTPGTSTIQSCAIWNSVSKLTGGVTITRNATMLTMAFATGVTFTGTVVGRDVELTYTHLHDFTDGCKWRATETLTGDLDPATCVMMVSYRYVETVEISNGACATPCGATGTFSLSVAPIL